MNHFSDVELACPCCGKLNFEQNTLNKFNHAREIAGIPFVVNSACRCWVHNKDEEVGGSDTSSHLIENEDGNELKCTAMDIKCEDSSRRAKILMALIQAGFTRIGIAKTFIHADNDKTKSQKVFWLY